MEVELAVEIVAGVPQRVEVPFGAAHGEDVSPVVVGFWRFAVLGDLGVPEPCVVVEDGAFEAAGVRSDVAVDEGIAREGALTCPEGAIAVIEDC